MMVFGSSGIVDRLSMRTYYFSVCVHGQMLPLHGGDIDVEGSVQDIFNEVFLEIHSVHDESKKNSEYSRQ